MEFTISIYSKLFSSLEDSGYSFQTFADFIKKPKDKIVILRHDVYRLPGNALKMARLEHVMRVAGTYYFRAVPESWDEELTLELGLLWHEVGASL
jgi:hypothetical protein